MADDDLLRRRRDELNGLVEARGVRPMGRADLADDDDGLHVAFLATLLGFDVRHALDVEMNLTESERRAIKTQALLDLQLARLGAGGGADGPSANREVDNL